MERAQRRKDGQMLKWEHVVSSDDRKFPFGDDTSKQLWRAKIPGGWLIKHYSEDNSSIAFVPDPQHGWDGTSIP